MPINKKDKKKVSELAWANGDAKEAYTYTIQDMETSASCPQCRAEELRDGIGKPRSPYCLGQKMACYDVLNHPHECGKKKGVKGMLVNGYKLREAIKMKQLELSTIQTQFEDSLFAFDGEDKTHPKDIVDTIKRLEHEIAMLQTAQTKYNMSVTVLLEGDDKPVFLAFAIKIVGGAGRVAKMWRTAASGRIRDRWERMAPETRKADEEKAQRVVKIREALDHAKEAEKFASSVRSAIATGNAEEVDIDFLDPTLLS